jgi:hypothetical protein
MFVFARSEDEARGEVENNIQREKKYFKLKIREATEKEGHNRVLHGYVEPIMNNSKYSKSITLNKTVDEYRENKFGRTNHK